MPADAKYIVIEGPIGVGKSSLARKLAATFKADLLLEQPAENPFLERFYEAPGQHALATQLFFLFQRVEQLKEISGATYRGVGRVADFMLEKDPLFAQLTLDQDEYQLYKQVYQNLQISAPIPDLVIYLQAPTPVLLERVNKRRVKYEMGMDADYLSRLGDVYTTFFHSYKRTPLLIINAAEINPVDNEQHYAALVRHISRIDAGKHYFNPMVEAF
ncbi:MAG: deoxynucleoside kinase [Gammaproteobacteria bacterium]|nr:deoxynucleoside kinase [Gammaproteobacteria bacterium]